MDKEEIQKMVEDIQHECHSEIEKLMDSTQSNLTYQDCTNVFIFNKLAELQYRIENPFEVNKLHEIVDNEVHLNFFKPLFLGIGRCEETLELQRILGISKDGLFGKNTRDNICGEFGADSITLNKVKEMGINVRKSIPLGEIYWLKQ